MTEYFRDLSDFDKGESIPAGWLGATHKVTEGTRVVHDEYGPRLTSYRASGYPVLGSYHVLRTPGSDGHGSLESQLDHWVSHMDSATPWWRRAPFILQVDAERWPYDDLQPDTILDFCALLAREVPDKYKVCYASRGQYGNALTGIGIDLWNAAYHSSAYPGDDAEDWRPYSGKAPTFYQYTSTPFDKNAYRGSRQSLLALIGGGKALSVKLFQVENHSWVYASFDGMWRRYIGDMSQYRNWAKNHGYPEVDNIDAPIIVSPANLDTLAGPCPAGPDPATTGSLVDIRSTFAGSGALSDAQYADLKAALVAAQPKASDVAAAIDLQALATDLVSHVS